MLDILSEFGRVERKHELIVEVRLLLYYSFNMVESSSGLHMRNVRQKLRLFLAELMSFPLVAEVIGRVLLLMDFVRPHIAGLRVDE